MFDATFSLTKNLPALKSPSEIVADKISKIPVELISYLSQLSKELENALSVDLDDIVLKALDEMAIHRKHLVGICGHYDASRNLELFMSKSSAFFVKFIHLLRTTLVEADLLVLIKDKIGSHVIQSIIVRARSFFGEDMGNDEVLCTIEYISSVFLPLKHPYASEELMSDQYGSHVLRSLFVTLSGKPVYYEHVFSNTFCSETPLEKLNCSEVLYAALESFLAKFLAALPLNSQESLVKLCCSQYSSPIIQMLLIMERAFSGKLISEKHSILSKISNMADHNPEQIKMLCCDKIASRVIESFVYAAPEAALDSFLKKFIAPNIKTLIDDECGNFVIQSMFIRKHCVQKLFKVISASYGARGLGSTKIGLLFKIVTSDICPSSAYPFLITSLSSSFKNNENLALALVVNSNVECLSAKKRRRGNIRAFHPMGCAILVHLFNSPQTVETQMLVDKFLEIPIKTIFRLGMDSGGSRVLESIFTSSFIDEKTRLRLFKMMLAASLLDDPSEDHTTLLDLAMDTYGSRLVESIFTSLHLDLKQALVEYLSLYIKELKNPRSKGQFVIKKCMVEEFILSKDSWRHLVTERRGKETLLAKIIG